MEGVKVFKLKPHKINIWNNGYFKAVETLEHFIERNYKPLFCSEVPYVCLQQNFFPLLFFHRSVLDAKIFPPLLNDRILEQKSGARL